MLDFLRYLLLASTLLNNYSATHLVNSKDLLELRSFVKALFNKCIEEGAISPNIKDLRLSDIIIIKGFYINIVFKAYLNKIRV
jgi:hypothetical protein